MIISSNDNDDGHNKVTTLISNERCGAVGRRRMGMAAVGTVAVAVDGQHKASQHALKWAIGHLLLSSSHYRSNLILLHVRHSSPLISFNHSYHASNVVIEREADDQEMEMLRPFRGFCARRQIKFEIVVVEDDDVAQALVDYAIRHHVENLLLGAPSRNGFSRLFKHGCGIASTVLKWIPNFCNVYVISKLGKLSCVRNAASSSNQVQTHPHHKMGVPRARGRTMSELDRLTYNDGETLSSFPSPANSSQSTDGTLYFSLYDGEQVSMEGGSVPQSDHVVDFRLLCKETSLFLTQKLESMEQDMKRLKSEQNQTIDMSCIA